MSRGARCLAVLTSLVVTASVAEAQPAKRVHHKPAKAAKAKHGRAKRHAKHDEVAAVVTPAIQIDPPADDAPPPVVVEDGDSDAAAPSTDPPHRPSAVLRDPAEPDLSGLPPSLTERVAPRHAHDWHIAVGPYLWASAVDAKVAVGGSNVGAGIDFFQLEKHAKFGVPLVLDAAYHRFTAFVDMTYGVIGIDGSQPVGPLMVSLSGAASSLAVDAFAGYRLVGDAHSLASLEARGGVRYQRTEVAATLGVQGMTVTGASTTDTSAEAVAGGRVVLRPWQRVNFSGNADLGLFGNTSTWSAEADAVLNLGAHVVLTAGYRTLTSDSGFVNIVMHGPRAALQVQF